MNKERLRTLAKYLKTVPDEHFYLGSWTEIDGGKIKNGQISKVGCKTTACAMGWACSIPEFRRDGLRLEKVTLGGGFYKVETLVPVYKNCEEFKAAAEFFDIGMSNAMYLFSAAEYEEGTAHDVIERIEELLA